MATNYFKCFVSPSVEIPPVYKEHLHIALGGANSGRTEFFMNPSANQFRYGGNEYVVESARQYDIGEGKIDSPYIAQIGFNITGDTAKTNALWVKGRFKIEFLSLDEKFNCKVRVTVTMNGWEVHDHDGERSHNLKFKAGFGDSSTGKVQVFDVLTTYNHGNRSGSVTEQSKVWEFSIPKSGFKKVTLVWMYGETIGGVRTQQDGEFALGLWNNIEQV